MENIKFRDSKISKSIAELAKKSDHKILALWATDCAEHVLSYFMEYCPEDSRPREAIEAGRSWVRGEIPMTEARAAAFASHAAAHDIDQPAACAAARAAGHASATAHVAGNAVHAATYAAKVATYATLDPAEASSCTAKERDWQYQRLLDLQK
ncbi:putative immunity protein [Paenibacillus terrigena]|uniref:putative immunity protein n=1 Tax=Paenibacillus terrigena TaxID=369333 RepID=UPI0028D0AF66|nr:hypothetical protein [Paenibacillus terrigena]